LTLITFGRFAAGSMILKLPYPRNLPKLLKRFAESAAAW
jgi:hypothetical protein